MSTTTDLRPVVVVTLKDGRILSGRLSWQDDRSIEIAVADEPGNRQREFVWRDLIASIERV